MLLLVSFLLISCGEQSGYIESIEPISPTLKVDLVRFDQKVKHLPHDNLVPAFQTLRDQYPAFARLYTDQLLNARDETRLVAELELIGTDTSYQKLYDEVQQRFSETAEVEKELSQAIENYMAVFDIPKNQQPAIYTLISGFAYQCFVFDDEEKTGIGVGLDMFLGDDFPYKDVDPKNPIFSQYRIRTYNQDHLAKKVVEVLVEDQMLPPDKGDFLSLMVWGGKKLYLMDQVLNFKSDSIVMEYTSEQLAWCRANEPAIWNHFFEQDLFYETNAQKFTKLVAPSPHSPGMPKEAPGQTGNYMGWQVVKSYMKRNPDTSIKELLAMRDSQKILDGAKYKPQ